MRRHFPGYFPYDENYVKEIWTDAHVTFDANVLLTFIRGDSAIFEELLRIIEQHSDNVFITNQAAAEVAKHWRSELRERETSYDGIISRLEEAKKRVEEQVGDLKHKYRYHPALSVEEITQPILERIDDSIQAVEQKKGQHPSENDVNERIRRFVEATDNIILDGFSEEKLEAIYREGEQRYKERVPPGYRDHDKQGKRQKFGDLIIWKEMLDYSERKSCHIIFVTNDQKDDWFEKLSGKTYGARPELRNEILQQSGKDVLIYTFSRYFEWLREGSGEEIDPDMIEQVRELEHEGAHPEADGPDIDLDYVDTMLMRYEEEKHDVDRALADLPPNAGHEPHLPWGKQWYSLMNKKADLEAQQQTLRKLRDLIS